MRLIQTVLLLLVTMAPTSLLPRLDPTGRRGMGGIALSEVVCFAGLLSGLQMKSSPDDGSGSNRDPDQNESDLRQLAHILSGAYGNALLHDAPSPDLESQDVGLENASIQFSFRLMAQITNASCQSYEHPSDEHADGETAAAQTCVLDEKSVGLRGLIDMLPYAAYRLELLGRSAPPEDGTSGHSALGIARIKSMGHLYRMVFALSRMHLDKSQGSAYLQAAREQLRLASRSIQTERDLCACNSPGYAERLMELSQLDDRLKNIEPLSSQP